MKKICVLIAVMICCSCQWLGKQTPSEKELVDQKMAGINMNEVDVYPLFPECDETASRFSQKKCFESHMVNIFATMLASQTITVTEDINDTVYVYFIIDNTGKINFKRTEKSVRMEEMLPALDSLLQAKTDSLPAIFPAQKQGVKVASKCKLPIIISTGDTY